MEGFRFQVSGFRFKEARAGAFWWNNQNGQIIYRGAAEKLEHCRKM
jgi:hypothetical protein